MAAIAILGISAFYHDSAAALIIDGEIIAAAQEERFTRVKHDASFPVNAIKYVLEEAGMNYNELSAVVFYDKPMLKFERLLETYHAFAPKGLLSFIKAMPVWLNEKLFIKKLIRKNMAQFGSASVPLLFPEHHLSHAASAYYPSPFDDAAILTIDGVGEWATTTISHGKNNQITILKELHFPHSVGLLYSAFTYYLGFKVNSGEYKLMGLAPYGNPDSAQTAEFKQKILAELVDVKEDGSIILNMQYFDFVTKLRMANDKRWENLFGIPRRQPESEISQAHMNFALAAQEVTELIIVALAGTAQKITGSKNLVMAGGVALNCVANSKIAKAGLFDQTWIQPAAGDAGGALGAAYVAYHIWAGGDKKSVGSSDAMKGVYLGPQHEDKDILNMIRKYEADYLHFENFEELTDIVSQKVADGNVVGWFQGRMEFGPRALGNRSILGDPRNPAMQKIINVKIKAREEFRPFAPSVLLEDVSRYFKTNLSSPYMLFVESVNDELRKDKPGNYYELELYDRLYQIRSEIQSVTHVDYSARIQTVSKEDNPKFWQLLNSFKKLTGCSLLINTSFNLRGEPIVCTPLDAYLGFMHTDMNYLVIGNYLFDKTAQKPLPQKETGKMRFSLD
ncbi:carbamoyltransferase [Mucilaginibacter sp. OK098]|uniref:carbamoyltransferase family protein n=1 Tax=Mucilaginibacter sp. OK098 TaxID=1855297 RepID=UPI0009149AD6|nr:carbamoyltransferase [Mucilaginibacter sp. OK098]SHM45199.1 carbamoyltransferase [Mucilaginibacter sp. OK098]